MKLTNFINPTDLVSWGKAWISLINVKIRWMLIHGSQKRTFVFSSLILFLAISTCLQIAEFKIGYQCIPTLLYGKSMSYLVMSFFYFLFCLSSPTISWEFSYLLCTYDFEWTYGNCNKPLEWVEIIVMITRSISYKLNLKKQQSF